jgi:hypothetical protein
VNIEKLRIWASGCAHVWFDKLNGRESLGDAIRQVERDFEWDFGVNIGDFSAAFGLPTDEEGEEIVRQFGALTRHPREAIYTICGNHDRNAPYEVEGEWFRRFIDPIGENTEISGVDAARMPFAITGNFERYHFDVGNIRVLMMSDVNEKSQDKGRGELGGHPGGVVSQDTFDWWVDQVESNHQEKILISAHHYLLRETTVATGDWEGMKKNGDGKWTTDYHGYYAEGTPREASYLCWVGDKHCEGQFEKWLENNSGKLDFWLGGHTHTNPDDTHGNKSHIETRYGGTTFVNVAALTRWFVKDHAMPHSRLFTFENGSDRASIECYMHTDEYRPQGFYEDKKVEILLTKPFVYER